MKRIDDERVTTRTTTFELELTELKEKLGLEAEDRLVFTFPDGANEGIDLEAVSRVSVIRCSTTTEKLGGAA